MTERNAAIHREARAAIGGDRRVQGSSSAWCGSGGGASSSSSSSASRSGGRGKASSSNEPVLETSTPFAFCNDWEQQTDGAPSPNHTIEVVRVDRQDDLPRSRLAEALAGAKAGQ